MATAGTDAERVGNGKQFAILFMGPLGGANRRMLIFMQRNVGQNSAQKCNLNPLTARPEQDGHAARRSVAFLGRDSFPRDVGHGSNQVRVHPVAVTREPGHQKSGHPNYGD